MRNDSAEWYAATIGELNNTAENVASKEQDWSKSSQLNWETIVSEVDMHVVYFADEDTQEGVEFPTITRKVSLETIESVYCEPVHVEERIKLQRTGLEVKQYPVEAEMPAAVKKEQMEEVAKRAAGENTIEAEDTVAGETELLEEEVKLAAAEQNKAGVMEQYPLVTFTGGKGGMEAIKEDEIIGPGDLQDIQNQENDIPEQQEDPYTVRVIVVEVQLEEGTHMIHTEELQEANQSNDYRAVSTEAAAAEPVKTILQLAPYTTEDDMDLGETQQLENVEQVSKIDESSHLPSYINVTEESLEIDSRLEEEIEKAFETDGELETQMELVSASLTRVASDSSFDAVMESMLPSLGSEDITSAKDGVMAICAIREKITGLELAFAMEARAERTLAQHKPNEATSTVKSPHKKLRLGKDGKWRFV